jgi:hypothetical protein
MSPTTSSISWSCRHPSSIPAEQWRRWLAPEHRPSPYLHPEWALFWERYWPHAHAEVWTPEEPDLQACSLLAVRRRRWGHVWVFCQPFGTCGGWLGGGTDAASITSVSESLVPSLAQPPAVQVALTLGVTLPELPGWKSERTEATSWIIDLRGMSATDLPQGFSSSHRRNVTKGETHQPRIETVAGTEELSHLQAAWRGTSDHESRLVLNADAAAAFMAAFAQSDAVSWQTAWIGSRPVATYLWLILHDRAVYVDGAVDREAGSPGVSHFLFARMLTGLCDEGVRYFGLGAGPLGKTTEGLARFKEGWGAVPRPHRETVYRKPWLHWLKARH